MGRGHRRCGFDGKRGRYGPCVSDHSLSYLWLSFLRTTSGLRHNSLSDESRTHIRPFIRTHARKPAGSSRVTSRPSTLASLPQDICCDVTLPPERPGRS